MDFLEPYPKWKLLKENWQSSSEVKGIEINPDQQDYDE